MVGGTFARLALLRVAQQLLEEQRIAFGALDATGREPRRGLDERASQQERFCGPQRPEIDGHQRAATGRCAPDLVQGIALDTRGHHQDHRAAGGADGQLREVPEQGGGGPVDVLDHDQPGLPERGALDNRGERLACPLGARGVVHRVEHGLQFGALGQVEQIVDE